MQRNLKIKKPIHVILLGSAEKSASFIQEIPQKIARYVNGVLTYINNEYVIYNQAELERLGHLRKFKLGDVQIYIFLDLSPKDKMLFEGNKEDTVTIVEFDETKTSVNECINNLEKLIIKPPVYTLLFGSFMACCEFTHSLVNQGECIETKYDFKNKDGKYIIDVQQDHFVIDDYFIKKAGAYIYLDVSPDLKSHYESRRHINKTVAIDFDNTKMSISECVNNLEAFVNHHQEVIENKQSAWEKTTLVACGEKDKNPFFTNLPPEVVRSYILGSFFSLVGNDVRSPTKTIYNELPKKFQFK